MPQNGHAEALAEQIRRVCLPVLPASSIDLCAYEPCAYPGRLGRRVP